VGLAGAVVVGALSPDPPPTVGVVVTTHDIAAGSSLSASDLRVTSVAASLAPGSAYTHTAQAAGRTASAALAKGTVLNPGLVAGDTAADVAPAGRVVLAIPADDDPTLGLLGPGDHVDLLSATSSGSRYLARRAVVLPSPQRDGGSGGLLASSAQSAQTLVVAVEPSEAEAIAARHDGARLTAVIVR
jgi:Flp pilus assembly protein CpaB